jgi:hypothetical protein
MKRKIDDGLDVLAGGVSEVGAAAAADAAFAPAAAYAELDAAAPALSVPPPALPGAAPRALVAMPPTKPRSAAGGSGGGGVPKAPRRSIATPLSTASAQPPPQHAGGKAPKAGALASAAPRKCACDARAVTAARRACGAQHMHARAPLAECFSALARSHHTFFCSLFFLLLSAAAPRSKKRKSAVELDAARMPPPSALRGADAGGHHGGGAGGFGVSPFVPGHHGLLGDSPFTAAACAAAAQFLASPFGLHSGGGAPGSRLRRAACRGSLGAAGDSSSALADFLNSDLASPGLLHAHHALGGRHASVSPLGLATMSMMGLHSGAASVGGATPPLLYSHTQPSPFGGGGGGGADALRDAAASFGALPTILRKRARFGRTPSSAMRASIQALGGGAGGGTAGGAGGAGGYGVPSTGRSAGTAAAVRAAQASLAAAETSCPLSMRRMTASAVSAMLSSGGAAGMGLGIGSASPAASSPADVDLARALFASPPPSARAGGPHSASRSTRAAAAAAAAASAHGAAGDLAGLSSPFGAASFWGEGAAAAAVSYAAAAAAAGGAAGGVAGSERAGIAAAAAAGAAAGGWQRSNARVSSIFRREPYPRDPRAAAGGAAAGAAAGGAGGAAAAGGKEGNALEAMRRVEFEAADVYTQAQEVLARPAGAMATPGSAPRAAPSARRGAASMAFVDALRGGGGRGGAGAAGAGGAAAGTPVGAALASKLAFAGGGFSPYVPAGGGDLLLSPDVCAAGDGLLTLSPSAYLLK